MRDKIVLSLIKSFCRYLQLEWIVLNKHVRNINMYVTFFVSGGEFYFDQILSLELFDELVLSDC